MSIGIELVNQSHCHTSEEATDSEQALDDSENQEPAPGMTMKLP